MVTMTQPKCVGCSKGKRCESGADGIATRRAAEKLGRERNLSAGEDKIATRARTSATVSAGSEKLAT